MFFPDGLPSLLSFNLSKMAYKVVPIRVNCGSTKTTKLFSKELTKQFRNNTFGISTISALKELIKAKTGEICLETKIISCHCRVNYQII
jgi:hypothetical protein